MAQKEPAAGKDAFQLLLINIRLDEPFSQAPTVGRSLLSRADQRDDLPFSFARWQGSQTGR
jgi:hypothetical protein